MAEWRRRQDLYRAYDGPIPSPMMARAGDGEVRLARLIRDSEERASRHEDAAEKWLELGTPRWRGAAAKTPSSRAIRRR